MANPRLPNQPSEEDLNSFLSKVDQLDDVLKGLNSENDEEKIRYTAKADKLIEKFENEKNKKKEEKADEDNDPDLPQTTFGFNKTSINKDAYKNDPPGSNVLPIQQGPEAVDQKAFMAAMEADAKERYERKKAAEKVAAGLKEKGNAAFRQGNYREALDFYNQAINEVRDSSVLYTNRAQAKIKLEMFEEALSDCDWALRAWSNCLKAYVHQGHAHMGLQQWDKARESYKAVLTLDASKEGVVKDYLAEVDCREQAAEEEQKATRLFEDGNEAVQGIVDLLTRVHKADQLPPFYAGGFRVIAGLLVDTNAQTIFRTHEGLRMTETHAALHRHFTASTASLSREERDVLSAALDMLTAACRDNETSQQQLLAIPEFPSRLLGLLEVRVKGQGRQLRSSCLNLLYEISLTGAGRAALVDRMDLFRLITALFPLMKSSSSYNSTAAALLNNIALEKRSKIVLRDKIEESILPAFENLLTSNQTSPSIVGVACSTATNLAADMTIRNKMALRPGLWQALASLMESCNESGLTAILSDVLGLLVNMSTSVDASHLKALPPSVTSALDCVLTKSQHALSLSAAAAPAAADAEAEVQGETTNSEGDTPLTSAESENEQKTSPEREIISRALVVLSNILPVNSTSADFMSERSRAERILQFVKCKESCVYKPALKCLTALTQSSHSVRVLVVDNRGLSTLLNHLTDADEVVVGNAALCLSHLTKDEEPGAGSGGNGKQSQGARVCARLAKTNVVQKLLTLARDGRKSALQGNCAILLGKLAQGDPRHLERLRELNGIQILHDCMKHVNN